MSLNRIAMAFLTLRAPRDGRCAIITMDPLTTAREPAVLRTVAREREGCLGVYGSTVQPGRIAVGGPVFVEHPA